MKLPLKPFSTALLTAAASGEMHAYAIERQMKTDIEAVMPVTSRAIYRELPRLAAAGLIEPVEETRPVRYRLTKFGRTILTAERAYAQRIFRLLQARL